MDHATAQAFFDWLASRYERGPLDWTEDVFLYPYSLFVGDQIHVETCAADTHSYILTRRQDMAATGGKSLKTQVRDMRQTGDGRWLFDLRFSVLDAQDAEIAASEAFYLCRVSPTGQVQLESEELTRTTVPFRFTKL